MKYAWTYKGSLNQFKITGNVRAAYNSYKSQKYRCYYKPAKCYKYYGGKGIEVEYSMRDFVAWYLDNIGVFPDDVKVCTSRIDHTKNYSFDNIELQTVVANSKERIARLGVTGPKAPKKVGLFKNREIFKLFNSVTEAEKETNRTRKYIRKCCNENLNNRDGFQWV